MIFWDKTDALFRFKSPIEVDRHNTIQAYKTNLMKGLLNL